MAEGQKAAGDAAGLIIDDRFRVLPAAALADLGGHPCFEAQDRRGIAGEVVALRTDPAAPPRVRLSAFAQVHHEAMLSPLAHGVAGNHFWIVTNRPRGGSLASLASPWSGNSLLTHVLRPAALALDQLQTAGLTHRAIRPDNMFLAVDGKTVVLGPAWGSPPAMHQPSVFEPPYSAICPPNARGEGSIADDVYALGVLLLALWSGTMPLAGVAPREIVRLKLEYGSHAALTSGMRLQRGFEDTLRAMLSEDPMARPAPAALAHLDGIHARRGGQRGAVRAARPIAIAGALVWNRRVLALTCAESAAEAMGLLRHGAIEQWLRRNAEDNAIAAGVEELRRDQLLAEARPGSRPPAQGNGNQVDHLCLLRLIALLDPLAPLFWRGLWLWPDGLGTLLAGATMSSPMPDVGQASSLLDYLHRLGVLARWRQARPGRPQQDGPILPGRLLRRGERDDDQAVFLRATYALNPFLPCKAQICAAEIVLAPTGIVAVVERQAGNAANAGKPLLDNHILAFLEARLDDLPGDGPDATVDAEQAIRELRMLARCQGLPGCGPVLRIAAASLPRLEPLLADWPGLSRKEQRIEQLRSLAAGGDLGSILRLMTDTASRERDEAAREAAVARAAELGEALVGLTEVLPLNLQAARHIARDTASAMGMLCSMAVLLYELLG